MRRGLHITVSLADQRLALWRGRDLLRRYPVSTSRFGPGCEEGSYRTPLGVLRVCGKFGAGTPRHTIFRAREPVGIWTPGSDAGDDLVLSRILWLEGLEEANANTYRRYIYIHGTNHEELLGSPASLGCVRMGNDDIIELFELVPVSTPVIIRPGPESHAD